MKVGLKVSTAVVSVCEYVPRKQDRPLDLVGQRDERGAEAPELIALDERATETGGKRWARQTLNKTLKTWKGQGVSA